MADNRISELPEPEEEEDTLSAIARVIFGGVLLVIGVLITVLVGLPLDLMTRSRLWRGVLIFDVIITFLGVWVAETDFFSPLREQRWLRRRSVTRS